MSAKEDQSLPTRLLLIRHAQTEWNVQRRFQGYGDSPITKEGQEQLKRLKSRLAGIVFDVGADSFFVLADHNSAR